VRNPGAGEVLEKDLKEVQEGKKREKPIKFGNPP